tara:strand:+ start:978 stop:1532 length:555 start_codon:yes stop_codon:yes gene_type:complete
MTIKTLEHYPNNIQDQKTFENFRPVKGTEEALKLFREIASGAEWFMLLCYGKAGCGKTHLCEALKNDICSQGGRTRVIEWSEQIRFLKSAMHSERHGYYDKIFNEFRNLKILIIDDIGSGTTGSSWEWGELEDIIAYRYKNELLTVLTTNLDLKDLPDRVVSRFRDRTSARICYNRAPDYRPLK